MYHEFYPTQSSISKSGDMIGWNVNMLTELVCQARVKENTIIEEMFKILKWTPTDCQFHQQVLKRYRTSEQTLTNMECQWMKVYMVLLLLEENNNTYITLVSSKDFVAVFYGQKLSKYALIWIWNSVDLQNFNRLNWFSN